MSTSVVPTVVAVSWAITSSISADVGEHTTDLPDAEMGQFDHDVLASLQITVDSDGLGVHLGQNVVDLHAHVGLGVGPPHRDWELNGESQTGRGPVLRPPLPQPAPSPPTRRDLGKRLGRQEDVVRQPHCDGELSPTPCLHREARALPPAGRRLRGPARPRPPVRPEPTSSKSRQTDPSDRYDSLRQGRPGPSPVCSRSYHPAATPSSSRPSTTVSRDPTIAARACGDRRPGSEHGSYLDRGGVHGGHRQHRPSLHSRQPVRRHQPIVDPKRLEPGAFCHLCHPQGLRRVVPRVEHEGEADEAPRRGRLLGGTLSSAIGGGVWACDLGQSAAAQRTLAGVVPELLQLVHHLREAGIPVSMVETVDAANAIKHVDMRRKDQVKATLGSTLVKRSDHRPVFEAHFELFFSSLKDPDLSLEVVQRGDARPDRSGPRSCAPNWGVALGRRTSTSSMS